MISTTTEAIATFLNEGRLAEAEQAARALVQRSSEDPADALLLLAISLQQQGRVNEAVEMYQQLTQLRPGEALHWGNYATALRSAGRLEEADRAYLQSLQLEPRNVDQLVNRGLLQLQRRDFLGARDSLLKAFGAEPDSPAVRIYAARACEACRDFRSIDLLRPWREWLPLDHSLQYELAGVLRQLGDNQAARAVAEDLLERAPEFLAAKLLLVGVYERTNQLSTAKLLLQEIVAAYPDPDKSTREEIAHVRAQLLIRDHQFAAARSLLEQLGPRDENDFIHFFTMAEVCDKQGDADAAIGSLRVAHQRQLAELKIGVPYRFRSTAPILPAAVGRVSELDYRGWPKLRSPDALQSPIFIVGFPRSGTTLLEQMLDAHPHLQSMDEQPFFNILANQLDDIGVNIPADLGKLNQRDCDELRKGYLTLACSKVPRRWDTQLVDKNPLNMLWLPTIHRLFPHAKFILALRHPCDVVLSCYMQNFRASVLATACGTLEKTARAYVAAMECWLYHVAVIKPDVMISRYEELVADTPRQTQRIAGFLGLDDPESMQHFDVRAREKGYIATPSYTQVIEPINTKGMNRWHRYQEYFESVVPILRPMLDYWGYDASLLRLPVHS